MTAHPPTPAAPSQPSSRPGRDAKGRFVKRAPGPDGESPAGRSGAPPLLLAAWATPAAPPAPSPPSPSPPASAWRVEIAALLGDELGRLREALAREAEGTRRDLELELGGAREALARREQEVRALEARCAAADEARATYRRKRESLRGELAGAREALARREQEVRALEARCAAAHEARATCRRKRESLRGELAGAREALARREQEVRALEARCAAAHEARATCRRKRESLRGELAGAREALARRGQEAAALEGRRASLDEARAALEDRCAALDEARAAREAEAEELRAALDEAGAAREAEAEGLRAELGRARERITELEAAPREQAPAAPPAAEVPAAVGEGELARTQERLAVAERTLAVRDEEIELLRGSAARAQKALAERESELETLRRGLAEARRDLARRATEAHRVRASLAAVARIVRSADGRADEAEAPVPEASTPADAGASGVDAAAAADARTAGPAPAEDEARPAQAEPAPAGLAAAYARVAAAEDDEAPADAVPPAPAREAPGDGLVLRDKLPDPDWRRAAPRSRADEARGGRRRLLGWMTRGTRPREPERSGGWTRPEAGRAPRGDRAAPPAPAGRAPGPPATAIHRYWEQGQAAEKLAPSGARDVPAFFADAVERAARAARGRTLRILAVADDGRFEVDMARRLHGMGVPRFRILARVPAPEAAREAAGRAARAGVAEAVRFGAGDAGDGGEGDEPFDVIWAHETLAARSDPAATLLRLRERLAPGGVLLVASDLGGDDDPAARAVAERVWPIVPERYRFDHVAGRPATGPASGSAPGDGAARLLPALLETFHFEAFFAWGNVAARFTGERLGPNLDPANERDRRFVDQLARLDDDKIEAGVLSPVRLVAALRAAPVAEPLCYRGWTPERCLARPRREAPRPAGRAAGAGITSGAAAPPRPWT